MTAASERYRPAARERRVRGLALAVLVAIAAGACTSSDDQDVAVEGSETTAEPAKGSASTTVSTTATSRATATTSRGGATSTTAAPSAATAGSPGVATTALTSETTVETTSPTAAAAAAPPRDVTDAIRGVVGGPRPTPADVLARLVPDEAGDGPEGPQWEGEVTGTETAPVLQVQVRRLPDDALAGYDLTVTLVAMAGGWDVDIASRTDLCRRSVSAEGLCL